MATLSLTLFLSYITLLHLVSSHNIIHMNLTSLPHSFSNQHSWYLSTISTTLDTSQATTTSGRSLLLDHHSGEGVAARVDWRERGAVTPVRQQGTCGACWAFAAVAALEGALQIASGILVPLSEQQLIDCVRGGRSDGCNGGFSEEAFDYITRRGGISTEAGYPYEEAVGTCRFKEASQRVYFPISGYEWVSANNEEALLQAVAKQPVIVGIDANGDDFKNYMGGIFKGECGRSLTHVITLVGFDTDVDGSKYWIGKNSWGTDWGEGGYVKLPSGGDSEEGICGIAMSPLYPKIHHVAKLNIIGSGSSSLSSCVFLLIFCFSFFFSIEHVM